MGPARLAAVLRGVAPSVAWEAVLAGRLVLPGGRGRGRVRAPGGDEGHDLVATWRRRARATDVEAGWEALRAAGVRAHVRGWAGYPGPLDGDPEAPAVLFSRGDVATIEGRRVAIVGSRDCSRYGREVAFALGRDLATAGVGVVSGLALGVDGAAHRGCLKAGGAPPLAVVGSGLDIVYPKAHRDLWKEVASAGAVVSEAPLGAAPEAWRFPARNRVIAALAEVVVVVESRHRGGARHTVAAAMARDRPVLAVPGPVHSLTSELPNSLLADGCHPARDAVDVLVALQLCSPADRSAGPTDPRPPPAEPDKSVLDAVGWSPASFEEVVLASGRSPAEVGLALAHLERDGWVAGSGGWWERRSDRS
ncbi:MAG: DNA-processing protein DprA, partial [Actinomycetota bacterium]